MHTHNLKIDALPFADLVSGAKTGEVRNDDRGFEVGDTVHLTCVDGQTMDRTISHIQRGYGLPGGICVLSYSCPQVEALETQLTATIAALEPFATYMQSGDDKDYNGQPVPDEQGVGWIYLNHGHFRKAHAAWEARLK